MTDISALASSTPTGGQPTAPPGVADELGADTFLQLLVAQLKYQDPTSPAEGTEFLAQTAQFTMVEKLTQLAEQSEASAVVNRNLGAASMVGRTVSWTADDGTAREGVVTRAALGSDGPVLTGDDAEVPFERISSVSHTPPPTVAAEPETAADRTTETEASTDGANSA